MRLGWQSVVEPSQSHSHPLVPGAVALGVLDEAVGGEAELQPLAPGGVLGGLAFGQGEEDAAAVGPEGPHVGRAPEEGLGDPQALLVQLASTRRPWSGGRS